MGSCGNGEVWEAWDCSGMHNGEWGMLVKASILTRGSQLWVWWSNSDGFSLFCSLANASGKDVVAGRGAESVDRAGFMLGLQASKWLE